MAIERIKFKPYALNTQQINSGSHFIELFSNYLQWCEEHPLVEQCLVGSKGIKTTLDRMRMPSLEGFAMHIVCTKSYIQVLSCRSAEMKEAYNFIQDCIHTICVEGAASGLLKDTIVAKKLGLADKIDITTKVRRVVVLHQIDNGRSSIEEPDDTEQIEDAEVLPD